ncbi:hypothetical protein TNCV_4902391 [Trichonephila clavipes]|nr:hypothetical protein TNCV_4902391 [Trichonephila clavipes]
MSQCYTKFIKNYADLCEPLYNLKRKLKKLCCSIEAQKAFDAVKAAITKAPVLKLKDFKKPFELFPDASSIGKLAMELDGTEFALGDIERWFDETRRDIKAKHSKCEKYSRRSRDEQNKVNA